MRIATMATGGIGGYLAVRLTEAGHEVATIARGPHLDAIRQNGLTLDGPAGRITVTPWKATDTPSDVGPVDAVILGVKGDALSEAARACLPLLGPGTVVVPFLNGVEAAERLLDILPPEAVANGMAQISTTIAEPGVIRQTGTFANFTFAERDSRPSARIDALRAALTGAGVDAPVPKDIDRAIWTKFVLFSAVSGVTAAGRCTLGDIQAHDALGALFRQVLAETAAIGRTLGVALPPDVEDKAWAIAQSLPPAMRASTAVDLEHGRPLEIEWVSGAAVRLAERAGVLAPANKALYALLLPHRDGRKR